MKFGRYRIKPNRDAFILTAYSILAGILGVAIPLGIGYLSVLGGLAPAPESPTFAGGFYIYGEYWGTGVLIISVSILAFIVLFKLGQMFFEFDEVSADGE